MHEASLHASNVFITLTYSDEFLPADKSLDYSHFQLFMKRLRKHFGVGIRFYMAGEYGSALGRPHFHAILFNFDFPDKVFHASRGKHRVFRSASLEMLWPFGFSEIGSVTFQSAAYISRYIMKKVTGHVADDHYEFIAIGLRNSSRRISPGCTLQFGVPFLTTAMMFATSVSVIVRYFNVVSIVIAPYEANAVLVVDTDAVLPLPVSPQFLQAVTRWVHQITQVHCRVEHSELSSRDVGGGSSLGLAGTPDDLCHPIGKTPDHVTIITCTVNNVKRYYCRHP